MAITTQSPHPQWATRHRKPGTELRLIRGRYYLYAVSSKYDPHLGRAKKITGKILGSISKENGFVESGKRVLAKKASLAIDVSSISVRESGFTSFLQQYNSVIAQQLERYLPGLSSPIIYMAYCRLVHLSPLKNMAFHISKTMLSLEDQRSYSDKFFSQLLRQIGSAREATTAYLKSFIKADDHVMIDLTNMFSGSDKMRYAKEGYNSDMVFDKQINLMYLYSPKLSQPVFYRLFPGNIREVRGFKLCLQEAGLQQAVVVADKGFYSKANIKVLADEQLQFIIPLKRDNKLIAYDTMNRKTMRYFKFEGRYIWYFQCKANDGCQLTLFRDDHLKVQEEKDYLDRIETLPEYYSYQGFQQKQERFGTIALLSNTFQSQAEHLYTTYKSRGSIEVMFDGIKNVLMADRTYMQNEDALQGWMFVNHIALQWYYIIYTLLKQHNQLKHYSVKDFIKHLYEIKKVKLGQQWVSEPIIKSSQALLQKLKLHIT